MPEIVNTPPVRTPSILEKVLTAAREKAVPLIKPPEEKKPEVIETKKPETPAVPDKTAELTKELEAAKARNAELESSLTAKEKELQDIADLKNARELFKSGKKFEAVAKLAGAEDVDKELDDLVVEWAARPSKETKNAVEEKLDEVIKRLDAEDNAKKKAKEDEAKAAEETKRLEKEKADKDAADFAGTVLDKFKDDFDLCLRPKHRAEACQKVSPIALAILKRDKINLETLTKQQAENALKEAFSEIEKDLEKDAEENYIKRGAKSAGSEGDKPKGDDAPPVSRTTPVIKTVPPKKSGTLEAVLERARKNAKYGT